MARRRSTALGRSARSGRRPPAATGEAAPPAPSTSRWPRASPGPPAVSRERGAAPHGRPRPSPEGRRTGRPPGTRPAARSVRPRGAALPRRSIARSRPAELSRCAALERPMDRQPAGPRRPGPDPVVSGARAGHRPRRSRAYRLAGGVLQGLERCGGRRRRGGALLEGGGSLPCRSGRGRKGASGREGRGPPAGAGPHTTGGPAPCRGAAAARRAVGPLAPPVVQRGAAGRRRAKAGVGSARTPAPIR